MSTPLLTTKLYLPPPASRRVNRPRLLDRLGECLRPECRLALLSAPAGFGKTTLVSQWIEDCRLKIADCRLKDGETFNLLNNQQLTFSHPHFCWLSLDEQDSDFTRFWTYLVAAFQTVDRQLGKEAQTILSAGPVHNLEAVPTILINDLARLSFPLVAILDDFHLIENGEIIQSLILLLDRIPPNVHVMILTRSDPHLPLARYRSRAQLLEIRMADLRFSTAETQGYLNTAMGLQLGQAPLEMLQTKTEGWAAGLQMAGLALESLAAEQRSADPGGSISKNSTAAEEFVASFSGSNRYILDYLMEEVLRRQPPEIQEFLLKTSILKEMCTELCVTVIGDQWEGYNLDLIQSMLADHSPLTTVHSVLDYLDRSNLFLIPLDAERSWYRYHHLFADLLRKRLSRVYAGDQSQLHARASRWYEENRLFHPAVEHAFKGEDFDRAGDLLEDLGEIFLKRGDYHWLLQWIQKLPARQVQVHGRLFLYQATIYASLGQLSQAEESLRAFEACEAALQTDLQLQDWLAGSVAAVKALIAIFRGDAPTSRRHAQFALEKFPQGSDSPWRSHLLIALSHINEVEGNFAESGQNLIDAIAAGKLAGDIYITLDATTHLVMLLCTQGQLQRAREYARQGLDYIEQFGLGKSPEASMLLLAWGYILCELHQLEEAGEFILRGSEPCRQAGIHALTGWATMVNMRYWIARGDYHLAEKYAREADQLAENAEIPAWIVMGSSALIAQAWIRQGKISEAEKYLRKRGIFPTAGLDQVETAEFTAFASVLLAKGELDTAEHLINQLIDRAESRGMFRPLILNLIQMALLYEKQGKRRLAGEALDRALELAEPEGYIQVFLDEGEALFPLLQYEASQGLHAPFAEKILFHPREAGAQSLIREAHPYAADFGTLTQREAEVLQLVAEGLSNKEIAQRLFLSIRTVKYHTTNIFTKLNVENRTQAVIRAKILGIVS